MQTRARLGDRGLVPVGEVRVAVAELLGQVELEPLGELARALDGIGVHRKPLPSLFGGEEHGLVIPAPLTFRALEGRPVANGDHRVLERGATRVVRMRIAGGDGLDAQRLGELAQPRVPPRVAPLVRALELDEEPLAPERASQLGCRIRILDTEPVPRTAGQADETLVQLRQERRIERRRHQLGRLGASAGMRRGQEPAEIRVSAGALDEQRHVRAAAQRHLGAGDRPHSERLRRVRELERAVDAVVVGQRERFVAELGRPRSELLRV